MSSKATKAIKPRETTQASESTKASEANCQGNPCEVTKATASKVTQIYQSKATKSSEEAITKAIMQLKYSMQSRANNPR